MKLGKWSLAVALVVLVIFPANVLAEKKQLSEEEFEQRRKASLQILRGGASKDGR